MNHYKEEKNIKDILAMRPISDKNAILEHNGRTIIYGAGKTGRCTLALLKQQTLLSITLSILKELKE